MAQGDIKPFWAKKQHHDGLRKLWFLFDKFGIYKSSLFRTIPTCALHHSSQSSHYQGMTLTGIGPFSTLHDQHKRYHESRVMTWIGELLDLNLAEERPFL